MTIYGFDFSRVESPELNAFAKFAEEYCDLIESRQGLEVGVLLQRAHRLLACLYAAGVDLPSTGVLYDEEEGEDVESDEQIAEETDVDRLSTKEWRQIFTELTQQLGEVGYYSTVLDPYEPSNDTRGRLADDLTDVYGDLRSGLRKWRRGESGAALWGWRFGLEQHWGNHAVAALGALQARAAWHDGEWPVFSGEITRRR